MTRLTNQLLYSLIFFLNLSLFVSCSSNDSDEPKVRPKLISSIPANNASQVLVTTTTIELVFDCNVKFGSESISINDKAISWLNITSDKAIIKIDNISLERGQTYTLLLPEGAVLSRENKLAAESINISFSTEPIPTISNSPCMPGASAQAVNVYRFLKENYGTKIVSASMANVNWNFAEANLVYAATGKYPAMATMDYIHMFTPTTDNPTWKVGYDNTDEVEAWWKNNGLVAASWHWMVPKSESQIGTSNVTYNPTETTFRPKAALTEGTWENTQMKADLAKIASLIKKLQDKNIPLIWRPLHEAAGNIYNYTDGKAWFWWGADGAEAYVKLWQYMFNYFKNEGINNLIWVWTTQTKDSPFYPGDDYVDIVGCDIYDKSAADNAAQYQSVVKSYPNKIVTLSECGNVGTISAQWTSGARWSYFMPWYTNDAKNLDGHKHANTAWWTDAMNSEFVITRDKMPSLK